jgi:hypothetical protein
MKKRAKSNNGNLAQDAPALAADTDKAKVRGLLVAVMARHVETADSLRLLLSQIEQASPYLLGPLGRS